MTAKKSFKVSKSGLIADKELFRIWFGFYQIALVSTDQKVQSAMKKSKKFYTDWGTDSNIKFDAWWKTHSHLFEDTSNVRLMGKDESRDEQHLYLQSQRQDHSMPLLMRLERYLQNTLRSAGLSEHMYQHTGSHRQKFKG